MTMLKDILKDILKDAMDHLAMSKDFRDVALFHLKNNVPCASTPSLMDEETAGFRIKFLQEELDEFKRAVEEGDLIGQADSLADLVWVALGTAHIQGIPWEKVWNEVGSKNMQKRRAQHVSESKRGSLMDIIKPEGWTPPDHTEALGTGSWPTFDSRPYIMMIHATEWIKDKGSWPLERVRSELRQQPWAVNVPAAEFEAAFRALIQFTVSQ